MFFQFFKDLRLQGINLFWKIYFPKCLFFATLNEVMYFVKV